MLPYIIRNKGPQVTLFVHYKKKKKKKKDLSFHKGQSP